MTPKEIEAANKIADEAREKAEKDGPEIEKVVGLTWRKAYDAIKQFVLAHDDFDTRYNAGNIIKRARLEYLKAYLAGKSPVECYDAAKASAGMI